MSLPNFLIVGAAKSGTTSLFQYLKQHPEIFLPELKEPSYFVDWEGGVQIQREYEALFSRAEDFKAVGEASTAYLFNSTTPRKIKGLIPHARIIIMLRNPVDMAFSLWRMNRRNGRTGERLPFRDALQEEARRMSDPEFPKSCLPWWYQNFFYYHRGLYYDQVKRYLDSFGKNQVGIFLFEELKENPLKICREIFQFLGVDADFIPVIESHNVGIEFRHRGLHKLLKKSYPSGLPGSPVSPGSRIAKLKALLMKLNTKPEPHLSEELRKELKAKYRPDIEKLSQLLKRDFSVWS